MTNQPHILVAPLDWGLGHATRCIPIIRELLNHHCKVSIAGSGESLLLLQKEFPSLNYYTLPSYQVRYSSWLPLMLNLMLQLPRIAWVIRQEHKRLNWLIDEYKVDGVISDNRYGCWSSKVKTIFITHQLSIQMPVLLKWCSPFVDRLQRSFIKKFSECWVPDMESQSLAGQLINSPIPKKYLGILSRFTHLFPEPIFSRKILVLLSGPEPQRSIFERLCIQQLTELGLSATIVQGLPGKPTTPSNGLVSFYSHLPTNELSALIQTSEIIICRSGYSSLMDLMALKKTKIILVPTPGQTEQEYLANRLQSMNLVVVQQQSSFDLNLALREVEQKSGFVSWATTSNLLPQIIREWLSR